MNKNEKYTIGQWRFVVPEQTLNDSPNQLDENKVDLTPYQTLILLTLVMEYPNVVSSEQLLNLDNVERQQTKNKLYQSIAKLRRIFNDSVHRGDFIETVPKLGYRLHIEPKPIVEGEALSSETEPNKNDAVAASSIFDDLSFIDHHSAANSATEHVKELVPVQEPAPIKALLIVNQSEHWLKQYTRSVAFVLGGLIIATLVVISGLNRQEQQLVPQVLPQQLYIEPLTLEITNKTLAEPIESVATKQLKQNLQWWLVQKFQHLPLIKIIEQNETIEQYPRLSSHLMVNNGQISINQTYYHSENDAGYLLPETTVANYQINQHLVKRLLGEVMIEQSPSECDLSSFLPRLTIPQELITTHCISDYRIVISQLWINLTKAANSPEDRAQWQQQISLYLNQIRTQFPENSFSYEIEGKLEDDLGNHQQAIAAYQQAIDYNRSNSRNFFALSRLYRDRANFRLSFDMLNKLVDLIGQNDQLSYWLARDLQQLGYYSRALSMLSQLKEAPNSLIYRLRFSHLNYNTLLEVFNNDSHANGFDKKLAARMTTVFNNNVLLLDRPKLNLSHYESDEFNIMTDKWRYLALLVTNKKVSEGLSFMKNHRMIPNDFDDLGVLADQVFYLNYYAKLLLLNNEKKQASELLAALIVFFSEDKSQQAIFSTYLAESYALNGQPLLALDELAKVVSDGWLPDSRYDLANLRTNPHLISLKEQWSFITLVQLVEQRQLFLKQLDSDSKSLTK